MSASTLSALFQVLLKQYRMHYSRIIAVLALRKQSNDLIDSGCFILFENRAAEQKTISLY